MLSQIVGQVDSNAAFVLAVLFIALCIVTTSLIVKRRSKLSLEYEFTLAKLKEDDDNARAQYQLETTRLFKFKELEQNLITSHRVEPNQPQD